ncbi:MAG: hypothetical protein GX267_01710 [Fibrobacter sp.]|mgnify:FL=1|jgi:hypothetical protein|nr:hypothetical protein [Fibrobacter sp.]
MRFIVKLKNKEPYSDPNAITISFIVPAGDIPFFIDFNYDKQNNKLTGFIEYNSSEPKEVEKQKDIIIVYGKNSGRIYNFELLNFTKNALEYSIISLQSLNVANAKDNPRKFNNFQLGQEVIKSTLLRSKDLLVPV